MNEWRKSSAPLRRKWSGAPHLRTCFPKMSRQRNAYLRRRRAAIPSRFASGCAERTARRFGRMSKELRCTARRAHSGESWERLAFQSENHDRGAPLLAFEKWPSIFQSRSNLTRILRIIRLNYGRSRQSWIVLRFYDRWNGRFG